MGAGSTVFAKNVLGDCLCLDALKNCEIALYDIDSVRLNESKFVIDSLNSNINGGNATVKTYCGTANRKDALRSADFVINAIQVGGYEPSTVIDFEIPKRFGLRQTIADTLGIGGIFRTLRTIPVMLDFARDIEEVCPNAWFLNYTNPMAMLTGAMLRGSAVKTVGLCHSVQSVVRHLLCNFEGLWSEERGKNIRTKVAGINHMGWLLEISENGKDLYPEIKRLTIENMPKWRTMAANDEKKCKDLVRLEMMLKFGYYITESSEHNAEYHPYFIKSQYPELIEEFAIPLDEYPRRCVNQIAQWKEQQKTLNESALTHKRSHEYGSGIVNAIVTNQPYQIGGNVLNTGLIPNLPAEAVVEVPCLVSANGVQGCYVGNLPPQCAALNRTNVNVQLLTIEAALTLKKEHIYHAAMLDPHTAAELPLDKITALCDALIDAHGNMLPKYR